MLETIIEWDKAWLLAINGCNSSFFDHLMYLISDKYVWIPLYLSMIFLLIRSKRYDAVYGILAVALTILLADQFASGFCKPFFERLRPTHDPSMLPFLHIVKGYTCGLYGFCSSHASNTWGIAVLTALLFKNRTYTIVVATWAALNCYSRMYLGVHYPLDILCGGLSGALFGWIAYRLFLLCPPIAKGHLTPSESNKIVTTNVKYVVFVYALTLLVMVASFLVCK